MHKLTLLDGKTVQRVFAGFVYSATDVERMKREVLAELEAGRGKPLLVELWSYDEPASKPKGGKARVA